MSKCERLKRPAIMDSIKHQFKEHIGDHKNRIDNLLEGLDNMSTQRIIHDSDLMKIKRENKIRHIKKYDYEVICPFQEKRKEIGEELKETEETKKYNFDYKKARN